MRQHTTARLLSASFGAISINSAASLSCTGAGIFFNTAFLDRRCAAAGRHGPRAPKSWLIRVRLLVPVPPAWTPMGCGSSMPRQRGAPLKYAATEGGAETNAMQALAQQIAALRSENVELQEQLTSTRSELAYDKQTIVTLKEQLTAFTSTRFDNVPLQQLQEQYHTLRKELLLKFAHGRSRLAANQAVINAGRDINIFPIFSALWPHPH